MFKNRHKINKMQPKVKLKSNIKPRNTIPLIKLEYIHRKKMLWFQVLDRSVENIPRTAQQLQRLPIQEDKRKSVHFMVDETSNFPTCQNDSFSKQPKKKDRYTLKTCLISI